VSIADAQVSGPPPFRAASSSAHGKVILVGEHAVVHGRPALAAALPDALRLHARPSVAGLRLSIPAWGLDVSVNDDHPVAEATRSVLERAGVGADVAAVIDGETALPCAAGLGSSATLSVALTRLILGCDAAESDVIEVAMAGETVFHGRPSGIDVVVAARGGVVAFERGSDPRSIDVGRAFPLVIVPSGIPRSTAEEVARVGRRLEACPAVANAVFDAIAVAVSESERALREGDLDTLGHCFDLVHGMLAGLGVSTPELDSMCHVARAAGARGAKLTGAGGGGCIIALPGDDLGSLLDAFPDSDPLLMEVG
jgi:mevalonate kinase